LLAQQETRALSRMHALFQSTKLSEKFF